MTVKCTDAAGFGTRDSPLLRATEKVTVRTSARSRQLLTCDIARESGSYSD
jgi:hypothetical protein